MDPKDPRMIKFKVDLLGMELSDEEFRPDELTKSYGFNPTQSRKICKRLKETAKRIVGSESVTTAKPFTGQNEDLSIDGKGQDTSDFATAAPGPRTVKKRTI